MRRDGEPNTRERPYSIYGGSTGKQTAVKTQLSVRWIDDKATTTRLSSIPRYFYIVVLQESTVSGKCSGLAGINMQSETCAPTI